MGVSAIDLHVYAAAVNKQSLSSDRSLSPSLSYSLLFHLFVPLSFPAVIDYGSLLRWAYAWRVTREGRKWVAVIDYTFCFHIQPMQRIQGEEKLIVRIQDPLLCTLQMLL